jgi:MFS family permease
VLAAKRTTLSIYLAAGCIFAAMAVRLFALPLRVNELGGNKIAVGLLFSVGTVTAAGLSLPAGLLADRFGKRTLLLLSIVLGAICQLGLGLSSSVEPLFVWQAVGGVGGAAAQAALMATLADVVPASRLGRAIGWLTLAFQAGFLIGPAAAGMSLQWVNLQAALVSSTALFALALVMTLVGIPVSPRVKTGWNVVGPLREIAGRRAFAVGTVALLGATLLWGTLQAYLPLFGKEQLRLPEAQIGYMIAIQAVANGVARIPGGRLVDRMRTRGRLIVFGLGAYAASLAVFPHLTGFWSTTMFLTLTVPLLAIVYLALGVVFTNLSTAETRGVAMGAYGMVLYLGLGFGPAVFGAVMEQAGYLAGFTACAATGVAMAVLAAVLRSQRVPWPSTAAA